MDQGKPLLTAERVVGGVYVVKLMAPRILDELQIREIGEQVKGLIDGGATRMVIDFSNVDHLSSGALGMLITAKKRIAERKGKLHLAAIRPEILQVFKITSLDKVFHIHKTTDEATRGLI